MPTKEQLAGCGIGDCAQAIANLKLIEGRLGSDASVLMPFLLADLSRVADPDMALNNLERFVGALSNVAAFASNCRTRPDILLSVLTLCGASRFLSSFVIAAADRVLPLLSDPAYLAKPAGKKTLSDRLTVTAGNVRNDKDFYGILRGFRKQEMLRIGLRDLLGKADFQETVDELSDLAEVCLQRAYEWADSNLRKKYGRPIAVREDGSVVTAGFVVIAMGKLGGRELNFSSDIDLMYVYSSEGETEGAESPDGALTARLTNHQYFVKLAEKITSIMGHSTEDGFVFRVDLRLRPEGQRGPLAQSLGGYEIYYESWGQTWERSALIKARPVAGDERVGREFLERIAPFVYRKYLDYGAISEISEMKGKINKDVQQKGKTYRDVKLGYGGIREIEFVIQALQLIYAGRDRSLREKNSLKALHMLSQKGLITYEEHDALSKAYIFLRTVEHRIQIENEFQTQTLPLDERDLRRLARRTGYLEPGREAEMLLRDYAAHTQRVREIYDDLFAFTGEGRQLDTLDSGLDRLSDPGTSEQEAVAILERYGFRDPGKAYRNILLLREGPAFVHQTPRDRKVFDEIFPLLFREVIASPDPDMALNHLESFLAAQGSWDAFRSHVREHAMAVKILITVFANSEYLSRMLVVNPGLLEDLVDTGRAFGVRSTAELAQELNYALDRAGSISERLDALRRFKHREEIRIGMADLLSFIRPQAASRALSRLAEVCLAAALNLAASEIDRRYPWSDSSAGLAVLGVGKLGGRELTYGSDLDIMFVYSESRAGAPPAGITTFEYYSKVAEKTLSYLTTMTREGYAYRVDTRLRPGGSKGPLVQSISAFVNYYASQARTWERQALINARCVAGNRAVGEEFAVSMGELIYRETDRSVLATDIRTMRARMEDEIAGKSAAFYNIKQGAGGIVDIEFLIQYLQLLHGRDNPALRIPGTYNALMTLKRLKIFDSETFGILKQAYLFLRLLESRIRVVTNQAADDLSKNPEKLQTLARRMGYRDDEQTAGRKILSDYENLRLRVREMFNRIVHA